MGLEEFETNGQMRGDRLTEKVRASNLRAKGHQTLQLQQININLEIHSKVHRDWGTQSGGDGEI